MSVHRRPLEVAGARQQEGPAPITERLRGRAGVRHRAPGVADVRSRVRQFSSASHVARGGGSSRLRTNPCLPEWNPAKEGRERHGGRAGRRCRSRHRAEAIPRELRYRGLVPRRERPGQPPDARLGSARVEARARTFTSCWISSPPLRPGRPSSCWAGSPIASPGSSDGSLTRDTRSRATPISTGTSTSSRPMRSGRSSAGRKTGSNRSPGRRFGASARPTSRSATSSSI